MPPRRRRTNGTTSIRDNHRRIGEAWLHTKVESALLLDIVVGKRATIFQLLSGKNQSLLVRRNALLVLDFSLDVINCVRRFDLKSDSFASEGLDKNLHASTET